MSQSHVTPAENLRLGHWLLVVAWLICVLAGMGALIFYESTPAPFTIGEPRWPNSTAVALDPELPTLVVFVHPQCPCSRASLSELAVLATQCRGRFALRIAFIRPAEVAAGWERTGLWHLAQGIPAAVVIADPDGVEAERFHAETSGETFLYSPDGRLLFNGGITVSRGHEGDNLGRSALTALINHGRANRAEFPVFGCGLFNRCCPSSGVECSCET